MNNKYFIKYKFLALKVILSFIIPIVLFIFYFMQDNLYTIALVILYFTVLVRYYINYRKLKDIPYLELTDKEIILFNHIKSRTASYNLENIQRVDNVPYDSIILTMNNRKKVIIKTRFFENDIEIKNINIYFNGVCQ